MQNRMTFYLTLGSTVAIAFYGVVGALYIELFKPDAAIEEYPLRYLILATIYLASATGYFFIKAYKAMRKSGD